MTEPTKLTIGARDFNVPEFPIRVVRVLSDKLAQSRLGGMNVGLMLDFVRDGLKAADATFKDEAFEEMHATQDEIAEAFKVISKQAGFKQVEAGADPLESAAK